MRKGLAQTSFLRKLLAYQETWRRGLHQEYLGIPNFRVLTVTTSRERVEHLVEACRSLPGGGSRLFLFTAQERLGQENILSHQWVNGRAELVQALEQVQAAAGGNDRQSLGDEISSRFSPPGR